MGNELWAAVVSAGNVPALSQLTAACTLPVLVTGYFVLLFTAKIAFVSKLCNDQCNNQCM